MTYTKPLGAGQVEKEEVRLRRTVGLKKDEYQLNKKKIRSLFTKVALP
jgi:hypothetical protein